MNCEMLKTLYVAFGAVIVGFSAAKIEEKTFGEESLRCKMLCRFGLNSVIGIALSVGKTENNKESTTQKCLCLEQNGKHRKIRSSEDEGKGPAVNDEIRNNIDNQIKEKESNAPLECKEYLDQKKIEYNLTQHEVDAGEVDINSINATFLKRGYWLANVTWDPPKKNLDVLENYLILYSGENDQTKTYCQELPKNQTFKVINGSNNSWKYPYDLHFSVLALPYRGLFTDSILMRDFSPTGIPEIIPFAALKKSEMNKNKGEKSKLYLTILIFVASFGCMIFVLLGFLYRRRKRTPLIEEFETIQVQASKPQNNDVYFASYLPENEKFSNEMATIAYKLGTMGYKVVFDQVDSVHMNEIGFNMWVDKQILEAKKYIVFCSPGYVRLWQSLATSAMDNKLNHLNKEDLVRVRYEIKRISDVYSENCSTSRIVCIKMDPKMTTRQLPPWMNHNMLLWPEQKEDVIRRLNDQAAMVMHV